MMARINTTAELKQKVLQILPKNIPAEAIESVEIDNWDMYGRYWVYLNDGWQFENTHTIHENSLAEIKKCLKMVEQAEEESEEESQEELEKVLAWLNS